MNIGILPKNRLLSIISDLQKDKISEEEKKAIISKVKEYSLDKFLKFLSYRERSTKEAQNYLEKLYLPNFLINEIITYSIKNNFLNDERFCKEYAISLFEKGKSRKYVFFKLKEKGLDEPMIEKTLSDMNFDNRKRLNEIIGKLYEKYKRNPPQKRYEKIMSYLVRNGFEYDSVKGMVKEKINRG